MNIKLARRSDHRVIVTDSLIQRVLNEAKTPRDIRVASSALREGAEQREDAGVDASDWRMAFTIAKDNAFRGNGKPCTKSSIPRIVAAIRSVLLKKG